MSLSKGLTYLDIETPKIIAFCGKGGVGKTTSAATTAFHFSNKKLKTLLISTDPTPSLSDILEVNVKGKITNIDKNQYLDAIELDYNTIIKKWKKKFGEEIYEVISSFLPVDREIIEYIASAPGIDEEFALSYLLDIFESEQYDTIIWDTAPAGGTLSLIQLQEKFYKHLGDAAKLYIRARKTLMALVKGSIKYDPMSIISSWQNLAERVFYMLRNSKTHMMIVTIPEALGVQQTERILKELNKFGISISKILINYVVTEDICDCDFHKQRAVMQKKYINLLLNTYRENPGITIIPQLPFEIKGIEAIKKMEKILF